MPQVGSPLCPLLSTRVHSATLFVFATTRHPPICHPSAPVVLILTTAHAIMCPTGRFPTIRHNKICDILADFLTEVCYDICIEPHPQPLSGETLSTRSASTKDNVRLNIAASGFWGEGLNKHSLMLGCSTLTLLSSEISSCYRCRKHEERLKYEQRIREIEHASFALFVMTCTGRTS